MIPGAGRTVRVCVGAALCAALVSCSPRQLTQTCTPAWPAAIAAGAAARAARQSGGLEVVVDGAKMKLGLNLLWQGDTGMLVDLFGPFGAPVATVESGPQGLVITMGQRVQKVGAADRIDEYVNFIKSPFTFGDFIRILSGELAGGLAPGVPPDSVAPEGRRTTGFWRRDTLQARVTVRSRDCLAEELVVAAGSGQLRFRDFHDGLAGVTELRLDEANYFVLTFDRR